MAARPRRRTPDPMAAPPNAPLYGAIEGGGTKFLCAVGTGPDDLRAWTRIATGAPEATCRQVIAFFREAIAVHGPLAALGVGCFGPLDLDPASANYGRVTATAKPGWAGHDLVGTVSCALEVPVVLDTDVNCALLGEARWGAGRGLDDLVYITVGTGIGGAVMVGGRIAHGLVHPEIGHLLVAKAPEDRFAGRCPYHGDRCIEGLASGPAIAERWGMAANALPPGHAAWALEAGYLATLCANLCLVTSPGRIILGGGVMEQAQLFPMIRERVVALLNDYVAHRALGDGIDDYIVPAALEGRAGVLGALALAFDS